MRKNIRTYYSSHNLYHYLPKKIDAVITPTEVIKNVKTIINAISLTVDFFMSFTSYSI